MHAALTAPWAWVRLKNLSYSYCVTTQPFQLYLLTMLPAVPNTVGLKQKAGPKLKDFKEYVNKNKVPEIAALKEEVEAFATQFPTIGFEKSQMRYKD